MVNRAKLKTMAAQSLDCYFRKPRKSKDTQKILGIMESFVHWAKAHPRPVEGKFVDAVHEAIANSGGLVAPLRDEQLDLLFAVRNSVENSMVSSAPALLQDAVEPFVQWHITLTIPTSEAFEWVSTVYGYATGQLSKAEMVKKRPVHIPM